MYSYYRTVSRQELPSGRLGAILLILGVCFHIGGTAFPYWTLNGYFHSGIWEECYKGTCTSLYENNKLEKWPWLRAVQAMAILGVIVSLFGVITTVVFLRTGNKSLLATGALSAVAGGILVLIGAIIYGTYSTQGLYWAFWFEVAAGGVMLMAGAGLFVQLCKVQN